MIQKVILSGIFVGCLGLVVGYLIFGQVAGEYVEIQKLINPPQDWLQEIQETITGIGEIRQNILISGVVGVGFGLILGAIWARK